MNAPPREATSQTVAKAQPSSILPPGSITELMSFVRHNKYKKLKAALDPLPSKRFDPSLVRVPYVEDFGTAYIDGYEKEVFHLNKIDEFGNTMLIIAAQNGSEKVAQLLISKGANPNHQNKQGQTAAHFAVAYQFFDLSTWLFDANGGGAQDTVQNRFGLTPYDGLSAEE
jgi:hypothetical protein